MLTLEGNHITLTDSHRHKFDSAIAEYLYDTVLCLRDGMDDDSGDDESPMGWFAIIGRRLMFNDSRGFVSVDTYPTADDARVAYDAINAWYYAWTDDDATEDGADPRAVDAAEQYCVYAIACATDGLQAHNMDMWRVHGNPRGPIG